MILPWRIRHCADTYNRYQVGADGRMPWQRLKGRKFRRVVVDFGKCVWYPKSKGVDKLESRWSSGVWIGLRDESGEILIGTELGVIKVR